MTNSLTVWLANTMSVLAIFGIIYRLVVVPVNKKLEALQRTEQSVADIKKELHPNGGTSLKDAVTRIEYRQMSTKEDVARIEEKLDDHIDFHMRDGR